MIWQGGLFSVVAKMLRRKAPPPTRGQMLRAAMREAAAGQRPEALDMVPPDHMHVYPGRRREPIVLRDGTPYDESGADENDWRL